MPDRWEILDTASEIAGSVYDEHMTAFVESFVEGNRRDRWLYLLLERPKNVFRNSHKLYNDLNRSQCFRCKDTNEIALDQRGVYYDFYSAPKNLTLREALLVGADSDGIFSIKPGKIALYFFHESEIWLCKR